jgi:hypothetical protein
MSLPVSMDELHAMADGAYPEEGFEAVCLETSTRYDTEAGAKKAIAALGAVNGWIACAHETWSLGAEVLPSLDDQILLGAELVTASRPEQSLSVRAAGADLFLISRFAEIDGASTHLRETIALMGERPVARLVYGRYWRTTPEGLTHPVAACLWQIAFKEHDKAGAVGS